MNKEKNDETSTLDNSCNCSCCDRASGEYSDRCLSCNKLVFETFDDNDVVFDDHHSETDDHHFEYHNDIFFYDDDKYDINHDSQISES